MDLLQVAVTSVGAFVALFLLSKLMGHRQISELSVFDYVNGITIGSIAAELATDLENWRACANISAARRRSSLTTASSTAAT